MRNSTFETPAGALPRQGREAGARWAASLMAEGYFVVMAIQATYVPGNHPGAELCQVAVMDADGAVLLNKLVKPKGGITREATQVNGITNEMVARAPWFSEVYPWLRDVLDGRVVVIYNAPIVEHVLDHCCRRSALRLFSRELWCDAMEHYSEWVGEEGPYYGTYRHQALPGVGQGARNDCEAMLRLMIKMGQSVTG